MKATDILGLGKVLPIDKLIDIVSRSVGQLSKQYFDRKDIDTKAYEVRRLAEAKAEEMRIISNAVRENFQITGGIEYREDKIAISSPKELPIEYRKANLIAPALEQRRQERLDFQESQRQLNIESITSFAADELRNEKEVTDEPVDVGWTARFFRIAEDVSSQEMQYLWGKILAGEVKQPKSYSLRTLDFLKNLSKSDAEVFIRFAKLALRSNAVTFILNPDKPSFLLENYGITFQERLLLEELGLLTATALTFVLKGQGAKSAFLFGDTVVVVERGDGCLDQHLPILAFTKVGVELLSLVDQPFDIKYINKFAALLVNEKVKVGYGSVTGRTDTEILHTLPLTELPTELENTPNP